MKKAIIIIGVGTSDLDILNKSFSKVSKDLKKVFNQYDIYTSFTSKKIMDKLKRLKREAVLNPVETLNFLKNMQYEKVIIQPLHIIQGEEYENLKLLKVQFGKYFSELILGNSILHEESNEKENYKNFIKSIEDKIDIDENIILVGHGGTHKGNESYIKLQRELIIEGYKNILVGTICGVPSYEDVLGKIRSYNWNKVRIIPLMFLAGHHSKLDICSRRNEESWNSRLSKEGIEVSCDVEGLVELENFRNLYVKSVKDTIS